MLSEVEPRLRQSLPPGHLAFARLAAEYSLLALERGDLVSALQQANQAVAIADSSVRAGRGGNDYLSSLLVLRSENALRLGRGNEAARDATRALDTLEKLDEIGTPSSNVGHAYYTLGRALQAESKAKEAGAAFRAATEHLQTTLGTDHPDTRSARALAGSVVRGR